MCVIEAFWWPIGAGLNSSVWFTEGIQYKIILGVNIVKPCNKRKIDISSVTVCVYV